MAQFVAGSQSERHYDIARRLTDSTLTRQVLWTVGAKDRETTLAATRDLETQLSRLEGLAEVRGGVAAAEQEAFHELYFPHRFSLLFEEPETELATLSNTLEQRAQTLKTQLAGPEGFAIRAIATRDPWLSFPQLLARLRSTQAPELEVVDGRFVSSDGHGIVFGRLRDSAFDAPAQSTLLQQVDDAIAATHERYPSVVVEQTGANRFAVASERAIKADIQRVSLLSTLAVVVLFVLVFRSLLQLVIAALPLVVGLLAAADTCLLLFGQLHAVTLAFGGALIGVCIDYPVHLQNHFALAGAPTPQASARQIWRGLSLACATTVAGLVGLAWTDFPGIRELALFTATGVSAALLTTLLVLPHLMPNRASASPMQRRLAASSARLLAHAKGRRWVLLPVAAAVVLSLGLSRVSFSDRLRDLHQPDPELVAEDERVRSRIGSTDMGRFVVSLGRDVESALQSNDAVTRALTSAQRAGELERFSSLHSLLWSERLQRRNLEALASMPALAQKTLAALEHAGFDSAAFSDFTRELSAPPAPLTLQQLLASPLAPLVRPFVAELDDEVAVITFLRDVRAPAALEARLSKIDGATFFDQAALLDTSYRSFRRQTLELMVVGLVFVVLLVALRYRSMRLTAISAAPALLAGAATLGLLSALGEPLNLLHLLSLLLVTSIGVDYGIFLAESHDSEHRAATLVSLVVACLTTVCSFGALALSDVPALHAMGVTIAVGVLLSLLLAPAVLLLSGNVGEPP